MKISPFKKSEIDTVYKQNHLERMKDATNKLIKFLNKSNIEFHPMDGEFDNVVLKSADKELKIAHHCFYRFSGITYIHRHIGEHNTELIEVTDDMYMNSYMKSIISRYFNLEEDKKIKLKVAEKVNE